MYKNPISTVMRTSDFVPTYPLISIVIKSLTRIAEVNRFVAASLEIRVVRRYNEYNEDNEDNEQNVYKYNRIKANFYKSSTMKTIHPLANITSHALSTCGERFKFRILRHIL
uniref:Uncharacterized protein n=1 Tax=Glossina brevipalpis TaxID=37001 RepID=A0A1A9WXL7_9MUSC